jgi:hypothetical protein
MSPEPIPQDSKPSAPTPVPVSPELLAWAQQTFDAREFLDGVREIEATGGRTFESLIAEVETVVRQT